MASTGYSGSESSSSGSSSGSSSESEGSTGASGSARGEGEGEEQEEAVWASGRALRLPSELCERRATFERALSREAWDALEPAERAGLRALLPDFSHDDAAEKDRTLQALFDGEIFHFTSPVRDFHARLRQGDYRPDIAKMKRFLMKTRRKQQKNKMRAYYAKLLPEVLISRERLLAAAKNAPPGPPPRIPCLPPKYTTKTQYKPSYARAKARYFEELAAIHGEVGGEEQPSEDENYPEGPPQQSRRQRRHLNAMQSAISGGVYGTLGGADPARPPSLDCLKHILAIHRARRNRREDHPELNTEGITLEDIKQRVAISNNTKKITIGHVKTESASQKLKRPKKETHSSKTLPKAPIDIKPLFKRTRDYDMPESTDYKQSIVNVTIKNEIDSDSENSFVDPVESPKPAKRFRSSPVRAEMKQEYNLKYPLPGTIMLGKRIKQEVDTNPFGMNLISQPVPIKLEDLEGIDMMDLPVELAEEVDLEGPPQKTAIVEPPTSPISLDTTLMENTHANFLALVRALFPAKTAHRASRRDLRKRANALMRSPIAPLNTWYSLSDDWCSELDSALEFLAGEKGPHPDDFVPYLQYMPESEMYQWIGAGRDCDAILGRLCDRWLRARSAPADPTPSDSPPPPPPVHRTTEPPPPRWSTTWKVRAPTSAELSEFRAQERRRFSQAGRPFTYMQHGYRSVVGPAVRAPANRASHASLLVSDRPRHVSFVALVRDAVARLPNGEGSRTDIITLLRMSQWIGSSNDASLAGAVSIVLERLHSVKRDPLIRYDQRLKLWIYLQRHRSEEEWERKIAASSRGDRGAGALAGAGAIAAAKSAPPTVKDVPPPLPLPNTEIDVHTEDDPENSNSDVDVDDSGHGSRLSPPPLLIPPTVTKKSPPKTMTQKLQNARPLQNRQLPPTVKQAPIMKQTPHVKQHPLVKQTQSTPVNVPPIVKQIQPVVQPPMVKQTQPVKQAPVIAKETTPVKQPLKQVPHKRTPQKRPPQKPIVAYKDPAITVPQVVSHPHKPQPLLSAAVVPPRSSPQMQANLSVVPANPPMGKHRAMAAASKPFETPQQITPLHVQTHFTPITAPTSVATLPAATTPLQMPPVPLASSVQTPPLSQTLLPALSVAVTTQQQVYTNLQQSQPKLTPSTRSLLLKQPAIQPPVQPTLQQCRASVASSVPGSVSNVLTQGMLNNAQMSMAGRRGVIRVLSPATPASGKSLISPKALLHQGIHGAARKRPHVQTTVPTTTTVQLSTSTSTVPAVSAAVTAACAANLQTRTVQLVGGRTVQLTNQTVHLPGGQSVQLSAGQTLQLSSLQLQTQSVRLPSGQTVQLATPQTVQVRSGLRQNVPRLQTSQPSNVRPSIQTSQSTIQLAGQNVQIGGQNVQLSQMQLGQTVKLPSGQSVQLSGQTVQLPSGQSVQFSGQTVQLPSGQSVQLSAQTVQLPSGQSVQLGTQTVQLSNGQTVQLSGQTVQLPGGQTVQLSAGQTIQLSNGQTVQLAGAVQAPRSLVGAQQIIRPTAPGDNKSQQSLVAKLLTNAQGQVISVEGMMGAGRTLQLANVRPPGQKQVHPLQGVSGVRVMGNLGARMARPLLLATSKPLHNIILQSDSNTMRATSTASAAPNQTIVLSNIGQSSSSTPTSSAPLLKLQQVNPLQQMKLTQGIKLHQGGAGVGVSNVGGVGGVRSVMMEGQQLKLVGGRHVLARLLRPPQPP